MASNPKRHYTVKEYFELEKKSDIKHEYVYGEIIAMVGASRNHLRITTNVTRRLENQFDLSTCETLGSDTKLRINDQLYRYPDVVVACNAQFQDIDGTDALINPILIVEILSKSTSRQDRDAKFREYQHFETFRYYLLVSQHQINVTLFTKQDDNSWTSVTYTSLDNTIEFSLINARLLMSEIYNRVNFENQTQNLTSN